MMIPKAVYKIMPPSGLLHPNLNPETMISVIIFGIEFLEASLEQAWSY
jgi:hypothetical protein